MILQADQRHKVLWIELGGWGGGGGTEYDYVMFFFFMCGSFLRNCRCITTDWTSCMAVSVEQYNIQTPITCLVSYLITYLFIYLLTYLLTYLITYLLNPGCRVLLEKLTGLQLVKKFSAFHGTRRFITALTSVRHLSLSWVSIIQSIYPLPTTSWRSTLILSTHLRLGLSSGLFPSCLPNKTPYTPLSSPIRASDTNM